MTVAKGTPDVVRRARALQETQRAQVANPLPEFAQLPLWPDFTRGTPNAWLRGALFAAIQGKRRRALKREPLPTAKGIEIRFTGWQLDQSDLDVWETVVHLARLQCRGSKAEFTAHAVLRALGRDTGKSQHEWLKDAFARLSGASVEITVDRHTYFGALLKGARDEISGRYLVELDPRLLEMYKAGYTQIDWTGRQKLRGKPLALWLHGWYASHAAPFPIKLETVREISGCTNQHLPSFTRQVERALNELKAIGAIRTWAIRGEQIEVRRDPSSSQRRHLKRMSHEPPSPRSQFAYR